MRRPSNEILLGVAGRNEGWHVVERFCYVNSIRCQNKWVAGRNEGWRGVKRFCSVNSMRCQKKWVAGRNEGWRVVERFCSLNSMRCQNKWVAGRNEGWRGVERFWAWEARGAESRPPKQEAGVRRGRRPLQASPPCLRFFSRARPHTCLFSSSISSTCSS